MKALSRIDADYLDRLHAEASEMDGAVWEALEELLAERDRLREENARLWSLAWALEDDARHGNLTGRAEAAWRTFNADGPESIYPPNYPDAADPTGPPSTEELLGPEKEMK